MELKKISNLAGIMDRILKIVQIIYYILMGVTLLSSIATMASAGHLFQSSYTVNLGNYILKMKNSGNYDASQIRNIVVLKFLSIEIFCVIYAYGIHVLRYILRPMKEGQPFENGISLKLRKLALVSLVGGAVHQILVLVYNNYKISAFDMKALFNSDLLLDYSHMYNINITFLIMAIILYILSYVFKYGEALQKESDETL